jgi:enoyl-CoA hydratase/carnithine racemase
MPAFHFSVDEGLATFVLSNPPQNRLSNELVGGLTVAIGKVKSDPTVRALLVRAEGEDFCFGGDVSAWVDITPAQMAANTAAAIQLGDVFEQLPIPVVAAVQGRCLGGGLELALRADIIVAGERALFGHSEQTIGVITFLGGTQRVAERAGRARAALWVMTAEQVPAAEMLAAGVISKVVPDEQLTEVAQALARKLAKGATLSHAGHKRLLSAWARGGLAVADQLIPEITETVMASADARQAIPIAVEALKRGQPRPEMKFEGR